MLSALSFITIQGVIPASLEPTAVAKAFCGACVRLARTGPIGLSQIFPKLLFHKAFFNSHSVALEVRTLHPSCVSAKCGFARMKTVDLDVKHVNHLKTTESIET